MNREKPVTLYDAELVRVDAAKSTLTFRHDGCALVLTTSHTDVWQQGSVGRLTLHPSGEFGFFVYLDPRLRRVPEIDEPARRRWGWRIGDYRFRVHAGVIPGLNGEVIARDVESLELEIPREFLDLCAHYRVTPQEALGSFIADVCEVRNPCARPREDGFSSSGSAERLIAFQYWWRTYGWRMAGAPYD